MPSYVHHVPSAVTAMPTEDMTGRIPVCYGKRKSSPCHLSRSHCSAELNRYTIFLHSRKCKIYKTRSTCSWLLLKDLTSASRWPDMSYIFISSGTSHRVVGCHSRRFDMVKTSQMTTALELTQTLTAPYITRHESSQPMLCTLLGHRRGVVEVVVLLGRLGALAGSCLTLKVATFQTFEHPALLGCDAVSMGK
jgi:hypothetical protein